MSKAIPNTSTKKKSNNTYQLRYYCEVDEVLPQTPDPDDGNIRERLFVPIDRIKDYLDWGSIGEEIFRLAKDLYLKFNYHEDADQRVANERHAGIVIKDNRVLLIHRLKNQQEYWVIPGGHRRLEDTGEQTVEREVAEETNIQTNCQKLIFQNNHEYYYLCDWQSGDKPELVGEEKHKHSKENRYEPQWVSLTALESLNLLPTSVKDWLISYRDSRASKA